MADSKKIGGLAQFLSASTLANAQKDAAQNENIVKIDIDRLIPNPYNAYGLREIESLAGMISSNNFHVEAIEVKPMDDEEGKYMIISGHRRRAAWALLLQEGVTEERTLPCIVRNFTEMHITISKEDGTAEDTVISAEQQANIALIMANRGQRKEKTIEEELWEIQELEPYVKILYSQQGRPKERGSLKSFFASILDITPTTFQRKKNLLRLVPRARLTLASRDITETAAAELSGLPPEEQEAVLDKIASGEMDATVKAIIDYKRNLNKEAEGDEIEPSDDYEPDFDDEDEVPAGSSHKTDDRPDWSKFGEDFPEDSSDDEDEDEDEEEEEAAPARQIGSSHDENGESGHEERQEGSTYREPSASAAQEPEIRSDIPEPESTDKPQNDVHKWFLAIIKPEIERLEKVKAHCVKMKETYDASDEKGAALKAARWEACRSYIDIKIIMLREKD